MHEKFEKGYAMSPAAKKLLAPSTSKDEILAYLKELKPTLQKDGIVELGLFGSYAKGTASASSDIDIVIRANNEFYKKFRGFAGFIFLETLRTNIENHFGLSTDLCNIENFKDDEKDKFFKGDVYV